MAVSGTCDTTLDTDVNSLRYLQEQNRNRYVAEDSDTRIRREYQSGEGISWELVDTNGPYDTHWKVHYGNANPVPIVLLTSGTGHRYLRLRDDVPAYFYDDVFYRANRSLTKTLKGFSEIEEGWDGESAAKIRPECIYDAIRFVDLAISDLRERSIELFPKAMPEADGSVSLYFERGNFYAEFGFEGGGTYHFFIEDTESGEGISCDSGLPTGFFSTLEQS